MRYATWLAIVACITLEISSVSSSIRSHSKSADCRVYDSTIATALYSAVCSQCYTRGLPQQADTLAELNALRHTISHHTVHQTRDIKRFQLNPQSQQVC